jgi:hypothetical protein
MCFDYCFQHNKKRCWGKPQTRNEILMKISANIDSTACVHFMQYVKNIYKERRRSKAQNSTKRLLMKA